MERPLTKDPAISYVLVRPGLSEDEAQRLIVVQRQANHVQARALDAEIVQEYLDVGSTTADLTRKGFASMLRRLNRGPSDIQWVIAAAQDRLWTTPEGKVALEKAIDRAETKVVIVPSDISNPDLGELVENHAAEVADWLKRVERRAA